MTRACSTKIRGYSFQLKEGRFRLDLLFTERVVRHWHRFLREVVDAHCLEVLKSILDGQRDLAEGVSAHGRGFE